MRAPFLILLFLFSCSRQNVDHTIENPENVSSDTIYDDNEREPVEDITIPPFSFIGKLTKASGGSCTASLVGEDIILTAAHCFQDNNGRPLFTDYTFFLGLNQNRVLATSEVILESVMVGGVNLTSVRENDWALARLKNPLGQNGFFSLASLDDSDSRRLDVSLAGYSVINKSKNDLFAQNKRCEILDYHYFKDDLLFSHNCDAGAGDSGAPFFSCDLSGNCDLYGIHVSSNVGADNQHVSSIKLPRYGVSSLAFADKLVRMKSE